MTKQKTTLTVDVEYDPDMTDPEGLATAMARLLETALALPGVLDEYGNPAVGEFFVAPDDLEMTGRLAAVEDGRLAAAEDDDAASLGFRVTAGPRQQPSSIVITFEGYGVADMEGEFAPIYIEYNNGAPYVIIWADINESDATHTIRLDKARLVDRKEAWDV